MEYELELWNEITNEYDHYTVDVDGTMARADPDIGIVSDYVDEWWFTSAINTDTGKVLQADDRKALYKRLTENDEENIAVALTEYLYDR